MNSAENSNGSTKEEVIGRFIEKKWSVDKSELIEELKKLELKQVDLEKKLEKKFEKKLEDLEKKLEKKLDEMLDILKNIPVSQK